MDGATERGRVIDWCAGVALPCLVAFGCGLGWLAAAMLASIPNQLLTGDLRQISDAYLNTWVVAFVPILLSIDIFIALLIGDRLIRRNFFNATGGTLGLGAVLLYAIMVLLHKIPLSSQVQTSAAPSLVVEPVTVYAFVCLALLKIRIISYMNVTIAQPIGQKVRVSGRAQTNGQRK